jgi:hypothetical protein
MPERRQVGRPVAGDPDRPPLAGKRGIGVVAGPLLKARGVGALDEHHVEVDARDLDSPDPLAGLDLGGERGCQAVGPPLGIALAQRLPTLWRAQELVGGLVERVLGLSLLDRAVDRRHRLLPGERQGDVREDDDAGCDQRDREDLQRPPHRRP